MLFTSWLYGVQNDRIRPTFPDDATQEELIAANKTVDEIAEHIGADSLRYLSLEGLEEAIERPMEGHCTACFCGDYPLDLDEDLGRNALEQASLF